MKNNLKILFRISSFLIAFLIIVGMFVEIPLHTEASIFEKKEKSYEIAVVFDNSGSMYLDKKTDWAQAKYAMEIFASMIDYTKDRLTVYPMWKVTTDGSTPPQTSVNAQTMAEVDPITINSLSDIDKISKMYTPLAGGTPFRPVNTAHDALEKSNRDEKWLVVLTDGEFEGISSSKELKSELVKKTTKGIKVQYIGIGSAAQLSTSAGEGFYSPSAKTIEGKLVECCNTIFQRSTLPANRLNGNDLNLDLSMGKLVVFAQGEGAKITGLVDSNGNQINIAADSGQRKYSEAKYSTGRYSDCVTDTSLFGHVVTFGACPKGAYKLSYEGTPKSIQIFYEPDVDIAVTLVNGDGEEITADTKEIYAGEYTITSKIIDKNTNEDVTNHELMGNNVDIKIKVKQSSSGETKEYDNGAKIQLDPDDATEITVIGKYLDIYTIRSDNSPDLDWLKFLKISDPLPVFEIDVDVLQSWYRLKDHDTWKPIRVSMTVDGVPLTDEELARTTLIIGGAGELKYRTEMLKGESAYYIYIAEDSNGNYVEPDTGNYKLNITATFIEEKGNECKAETKTAKFEIRNLKKGLKDTLTIIFWVGIIVLIVLFLLTSVKPKKVKIVGERYNRSFNIKSTFETKGRYNRNLKILGGRAKTIRGFNNTILAKMLPGYKNLRSFKLVDVRTSPEVSDISINNLPYECVDGRLYGMDGNEVRELDIYSSPITWTEPGGTFEGQMTVR